MRIKAKVKRKVIKYRDLKRVGGAATKAEAEMAETSEERKQKLASSAYGGERERSDTWLQVCSGRLKHVLDERDVQRRKKKAAVQP